MLEAPMEMPSILESEVGSLSDQANRENKFIWQTFGLPH